MGSRFTEDKERAQGSPTPRFRVERALGRGGMGVVQLAWDEVRGQRVAVKRLLRATGTDARRLKHEFRAIEQVRHPNILSLYELGQDEEGLYLAMELVDGPNVRAWCRAGVDPEPNLADPPGTERTGGPLVELSEELPRTTWGDRSLTLDLADPAAQRGRGYESPRRPLDAPGYARLLGVVTQVISALRCLHDHGLVHRDLKPSNVLVDQSGTVKLLDFGILGETASVPVGALQGTVAYIAPEQARGEAPDPANDLYSLGVMLFEIVTGALPFVGATRHDVLAQHLEAEPPRVRLLAPDCPEWAEVAIGGLLAKDPRARLSLDGLEAVVAGVVQAAPRPSVSPTATRLVERQAEQRALADVLDQIDQGAFRFVAIGGPTGVGKSALLEWQRNAARRRGHWCFQSRVRFTERVPFNAIDGLVDDLAVAIERTRARFADEEAQAQLAIASVAFPVLGHLYQGESAAPATVDPAQIFDALLGLVERQARGPERVVLFCDDLQWADADSVALLQRLVVARPANVSLIATVRDDMHSAPFERWWSRALPDVRLPLKKLTEEGLVRLITLVAEGGGRSVSASDARALAAGCDGRPFFALATGQLLAEEGPTARGLMGEGPIATLLERHAGTSTKAWRLLSLLGVIDGETSLERLARLTASSPGEVDERLGPLVHTRLVQASGSFGGERTYDFAHDLVRRQVLRHLSAGDLIRAHAEVAEELERSSAQPAETVRHLVASHQLERAASLAETAASRAVVSNAFGLAADLYELAILHGRSEKGALRAARAVALERSGRYLDASVEWGKLADQSAGEARIDTLLNQAKALLATTHISEGRRILETARREQRESWWASGAPGAALAIAQFLIGPRRHFRPPKVVRPTSSAAERDVFLGTMVGYFDPMAGVRLMLSARSAYLSAGILTQAAEVEYVLAYIAYFGEARHGHTALARRYTESARAMLGGAVTPEHGRPYALDLMVEGVQAQHRGHWPTAARLLDAAIDFYEASGRRGSFEHQFCWVQRIQVDRHRQDVPTLARTVDAFRRVADEGQDSALRCHLLFHEGSLELYRGNPGRAKETAQRAFDEFPQNELSYQRFLTRFYLLSPEIYLSDGVSARDRLRVALREHARFMPMRTMFGGDVASHAALFEARALRYGVPDASYGRVERLAAFAAKAPPLGRNLALRALGYAADAVGRTTDAVRFLERAELSAETAGQRIDVAIARYQRGRRLGGDAGRALRESALRVALAAGAHPRVLEEDP